LIHAFETQLKSKENGRKALASKTPQRPVNALFLWKAGMKFEDGPIQGFKLKFKSVDDDTERYLFALVDLLDTGKIQQVPDQSLYASHYDEGYAWIIDSYFEKGLLDKLEAYFTPSGEVLFAPMHQTQLEHLDRMLGMGEGARVRRIWRAHLGHMKSHYWFFVHERNKGFKSVLSG